MEPSDLFRLCSTHRWVPWHLANEVAHVAKGTIARAWKAWSSALQDWCIIRAGIIGAAANIELSMPRLDIKNASIFVRIFLEPLDRSQ